MIEKSDAQGIIQRYGLAVVSGGYGLGVCAFASGFFSRPLLGIWHESDLPTEEELEQLRSYQEFKIRSYYNETWTQKLLAMKPPVDEGVNTLIFWKGYQRQFGIWAYRRISWEQGPLFLDRKKNGHRFLTVASMLDSVEHLVHGPFEKWKREHAAVFVGR